MGKNKRQNIKKNKPGSVFKITAVLVALIFLAGILFLNPFKSTSISEREYTFTKEGELVITDSSGNSKIRLDIEFANNDYDRQLGLMFRRNMEENQGMLFIFPAEEMQSFWMRNTYIPLDILFINSEKEIITIHRNTVPLSDNSYPSSEAAKYVLEVNAGFTNKYNISEGNKVMF